MTVDANSRQIAEARERQLRVGLAAAGVAALLGIVAVPVQPAAGIVVALSAGIVAGSTALSIRGWRAATAVWAAGADPRVLRSVTLRTGAAALFALLVALAVAIAVAVPALVHLAGTWTWVDPVLLGSVILSAVAASAGAFLWVRVAAA